ncbi:hypothetical protein V3Q77_08205 [Flavobacterium davisii]|uniref:Uncharacterized protein n=1 Tax=Flavobacterium davisii TaxID=2906077 RepID=A0ABW8PPH4_9FLAO
MEFIKIKKNNIYLDYVSDSLNIKEENYSFSSEIKLNSSSFPFLIIENENTSLVLGSRDITSINKKKNISIEVEFLGITYEGVLSTISFIPGFRKCNIKFFSPIFSLLTKKVGAFMPVMSVIPNENNPEPYTSSARIRTKGFQYWKEFPKKYINKGYPEVKFNFPSIFHPYKHEKKEYWKDYKEYINCFDSEKNFLINDFSTDFYNNSIFFNQNEATPYLYLLSVLEFVFSSINYKVKGSFFDSDFIKKIMIFSENSNICDTDLFVTEQEVSFDSRPFFWEPTKEYYSLLSLLDPNDANVIIEYDFEITETDLNNGLKNIKIRSSLFGLEELLFSDLKVGKYKGFYETVIYGMDQLILVSSTPYKHRRLDLKVLKTPFKSSEKGAFKQIHPTIDFSRYVPDKTVGSFLNELKKMFNLKLVIDDFEKTVLLDFIELDLYNNPLVLNRVLYTNSFEMVSYVSFLLKMKDEQESIYIDLKGSSPYINQSKDDCFIIESDFKFLNHNKITSEINKSFEEKQGIGLFLYDEKKSPYTSFSFESQTLSLKDTYEYYWKRTLAIRLNSSSCEFSGLFSLTELNLIRKVEDVFINNQHYKIISIEYSKETENFVSLKLKLESVYI